jgi:polyribonucleotide nucleotidyltransferase
MRGARFAIRSGQFTRKHHTVHKIETTFAGRPLVIETGKLARQAAGSVTVRFGDTMVIAAVTVSPTSPTCRSSRSRSSTRKRPTRPARSRRLHQARGTPVEKRFLACRIIDRSIRPLFPEGFKNEVQVFVTVVSADQEK